VLAYRDPAFFGTWIYWQLQGHAKREDIPEFQQTDPAATFGPFRGTLLRAYGFEPALGIAWFRRVRTQVSWRIERVDVEKSYLPSPDGNETTLGMAASQDVDVGMGRANLSFDFRAREHSVMTGTALGGGIDFGRPGFGGDLNFWRAGGGVEHGIKFFRSHNLVFTAGGTFGRNLPFWLENTAGGTNLRGYLYQQYRGDSQVRGEFEYHFPLFSIGSLDFRALGFYDVSAIWWQDLPASPDPGSTVEVVRNTRDQRNFFVGPAGYQEGFQFKRDIHQSVGGGLRFFLRSVAVPLVGFDAGYSLEAQTWRFILIVGA
jgi:outer membrane protein assembly factor BamA